MTELDIGALLSGLNDRHVRFVVIGGVAVGAHGYVRATEDLDIVPAAEPENIKRLSAALVALEARIPRANGRLFKAEHDEAPLHMGKSLTLETRFGDLDLVQRVPGVPSWVDLENEAVDSDVLGVPVRICSLEHLRQMKQARAADRDLLDLKNLEDS